MLAAGRERMADEIARCQTVYKGFGDAGKMILRLVDVLDRCAQRYGGLEKNTQLRDPALEEPKVRLAQGKSLNYGFTVSDELFLSMLQRAAAALGDKHAIVAGCLGEFRESHRCRDKQATGKLTLEDGLDLWQSMRQKAGLAPDFTSLLFAAVLSKLYPSNAHGSQENEGLEHWQQGFCPICGQTPHYGQLYSEQGVKALECWLCGTQWNHIRLQCPFCGIREHDKMRYFSVEGRDFCRVYVCHSCSQYYKVFDTREMADPAVVLSIHHLASLEYDVMAEQEGFCPGSGLSWTVEA